MKKNRRVSVGPHATFYFENYDTMFQQIHEMLHIEKGGAEQLADELSAYNPLIPQGNELVATVMFEIEDPVRRDGFLRSITWVEKHLYIDVGGEHIIGEAETDVERTKADGKTSSVHFVHFRFTAHADCAVPHDPSVPVMAVVATTNFYTTWRCSRRRRAKRSRRISPEELWLASYCSACVVLWCICKIHRHGPVYPGHPVVFLHGG